MDKLKMHSPNFVDQNIAKIAELFPNCVTESRNAQGELQHAIDFDLLKQELSAQIVEGPQERYQLNWPGKREALLTANAPIAKTLRPCREESVDFDTTKNLFVEGDNLDALKLLQETYLGKVKLIYIDPPYNTGNDFIYEDDFAEDAESYKLRSNEKDQIGNRLVVNAESNGRFHSDWLSMIYSRIKLAFQLLSDNGLLFISIDDNEVHNLKRMSDEIFGDTNYVAQIIWKKRSTPPNDRMIGAQHEYILVYGKNGVSGFNLRQRSAEQVSRYKNPDNHPKGAWTPGDLMANVKGGRYVESLYYPIKNPRTGEEHYPSSNGNWRFNSEKILKLIDANEIYFGDKDDGRPKLKRFLCDVKDGIAWTTLWDFAPLNTVGSSEMGSILGNLSVFENPKPTDLIKLVIEAGSKKDSIVMDFFSGSATTAHATIKQNVEDGGCRKFILVQLPEICHDKSEAFKAGYKTIAEISKERIRRAGKKIKEENADKEGIENLDIGFRVLKVDTSNLAEVYYNPAVIKQEDLFTQVDNLKPDRTEEDLLFQVMLDWGVDLTLPIRRETIANKTVFFVDKNALVACFDKHGGIDDSFVKELAKHQPVRAVFRDAGFKNDDVKINVEQVFKLLSPVTQVKTL
jgi:adenine-specific DNA-methyltransferase